MTGGRHYILMTICVFILITKAFKLKDILHNYITLSVHCEDSNDIKLSRFIKNFTDNILQGENLA